jgi:hypothetical protein
MLDDVLRYGFDQRIGTNRKLNPLRDDFMHLLTWKMFD